MNYEQKYKEALERVNRMVSDGHLFVETAEEYFPELKESEDERIPKLLHKLLCSEVTAEQFEKHGLTVDTALYWLEKQSEQKPFDYENATIIQKDFAPKSDLEAIDEEKVDNVNKLKVGDNVRITCHSRSKVEQELYNQKVGIIRAIWDLKKNPYGNIVVVVNGFEDCFLEDELELVEDNQEPKFKVGDWVLNSVCYPIRITSIDGDMYSFSDGTAMSISFIDNNYHIWTIADAKDGDVLVTKENKRPFIFKGLLDSNHPNCPVAHCGIVSGSRFLIYWWTDVEVCPATKEQRDLLFQKMKEAGYEWNDKEKELKKIKQETDNNYE